MIEGIPQPESLRYFSPFSSSPENHPERHKYITECDIKVFDGELLISPDDMWQSEELELYHSYVHELGPCMGPYFYNLWMSGEQIKVLLKADNEQLIRLIPRYIVNSDLLNEIERFCWIYNYREEYFNDEIKFFSNCSNVELSKNDKFEINSDFHKLLTSEWKHRWPFISEIEISGQKENHTEWYESERIDENIFYTLKENVSKEYSQYFLSENSIQYIKNYILSIMKTGQLKIYGN